MTTTLSFATRDCVVIGCDSLATSSRPMIDPFELLDRFIEVDKKGDLELKKGKDGKVIFKQLSDLSTLIEDLPYNQQTNVTKIYNIQGCKVGVLFAGIASIGEMSVKNIIDDFTDEPEVEKYIKSSVTVKGITNKLADYIKKIYDISFKGWDYKPVMEIITSGYSDKHNKPEIFKTIFSSSGVSIEQSCKRGEHKIVFGGQYDIIERIVLGIDFSTFNRYTSLIDKILSTYHSSIEKEMAAQGAAFKVPKPNDFNEVQEVLKERFWSGVGFPLANFSEQAAIDFVEFLVQVMIKSQQFSSKLPTVGGDIHMAIITKSGGFRWLSKEEYKFQGNGVSKHEKE